MSYHLLTGATGLLGNYLLRDLLLRDVPVAVLVRPTRKQTVRQRIEVALCHWDAELGKSLPRPVVLEGDIAQPDLGLDAVNLRWASEYCSAVIHNAASLTFHSTSSEGEPWRSNIEGTRNVLDFCRNTGIRKLHHVSTAYVAGLRQGKILETELNVRDSRMTMKAASFSRKLWCGKPTSWMNRPFFDLGLSSAILRQD